jgi:DEAD/DEAH box helicase domain-containing protein
MLPAHLAENIRKQVLFYLQSTFDFRDAHVERAFTRFLEDPDTGLFKGPWVQLRRPFRPATADAKMPLTIRPGFHPFRHQWQSWMRLSSQGQKPQATIVTTGTGSGKTECFLYPILDHCLRMRKKGQQGIKALVLYPMNALAADQEKRFAKVVWKDKQLRDAGVRVGNYTGRYDPSDPGASEQSGHKTMGEDHGISNHAAQQEDPPDILLTNYKMLDYLLLRPQDQNLWRFNLPGVLQYLVLDELHTYDGAQGADVACLIRRLKERLDIPQGELCVVGTSATLDNREGVARDAGPARMPESQSDAPSSQPPPGGRVGEIDAKETATDRLARFASTLFEENIPVEAVIGEDRLTVEEIVRPETHDIALPDPAHCAPLDFEDALKYAMRQARLWGGPEYRGPEVPASAEFFNKKEAQRTEEEQAIVQAVTEWSLELGDWLKSLRLFKYVLEIFQKAELAKEDPLDWGGESGFVSRLAKVELEFAKCETAEERSAVVASFFALVANAQEKRSGVAFPLVPTQVQLWIRELRRLGRMVDEVPVFSWLDEPVQGRSSLPVFHCSECGESGWIALHDSSDDSLIQSKGVDGVHLLADPSKIYRGWFGYRDQRDQHIVVISPSLKESRRVEIHESWESNQLGFGFQKGARQQKSFPVSKDEPQQLDFGFEEWYFCPASLVLRRDDGPCPLTGDARRFLVKVNRDTGKTDKGVVYGDQKCPNCGSKEGVFFIGSQSATLSSVAIDEMFGSVLNTDPKLLAFTDSVQDASHRAGFFTARTYHFTFRTALQHLVDDAGGRGVPLAEVGRQLLEWWSQPLPGYPGKIKEVMASLMPPDLQQYEDFKKYRDEMPSDEPPKKLRGEIEHRLTWEATSEFGLMQTHGRTMETAGSSCLGWDEKRIALTVASLRERMPSIDSALMDVTDEQLRLWIYGMLHRYRLRGALNHPYLQDFATKRFWGKYPFGRRVEGRETYPSAGHYKPHLMVTQPQKEHEHVLSPTKGNRSPWHIVWARRALAKPAADEASLLDLIHALLRIGAEKGLFKKLHQDGAKEYYAIAPEAAILYSESVHLACSMSGRSLVRPSAEAALWNGAPSIEYYADRGRYGETVYTPRQRYYQSRYRKGALRRVVAHEHTGLLATEEREELERNFMRSAHADDPNVLTCTSTLEMGIDIGDLSSTMLCSIPPNTASYLQRIGRAGRATGTALIVSVVNQRPHDLFFYARPAEMLKGRVDPPGCWLDASAVLVRQYLAYCFDSATKTGELVELPRSAKALVEDMDNPNGHIPRMMEWVTKNEEELRVRFLWRFHAHTQPDTRDRFRVETSTDLLLQRIHVAAGEYERMRRDLENARNRLQDQFKKLDEEEKDAKQEINLELHLLRGRMTSLGRTSALEILTDHGLLPNYAFPERGVRFYGAIYNKHRGDQAEHKPIELVRAASVALRELAPANHFYTHSRRFDIQQVAIGNQNQPLIEQWAICGACGHMRRVEQLQQPGAIPACPQCRHDSDSQSQLDRGQHRQFIEFSRSQAMSYMEHYDSMSGDRDEERQRGYYQVVRSFDTTLDTPRGAVGDDGLPFGIEYREAMVLREVNVGYQGEPGVVPFGVDQAAPDDGFRICKDCGVAIPPATQPDDVNHRRSCQARRRFEKLKQEGKSGSPFKWESIYLYRQLQSEAVRLLLPLVDDKDLDTLRACIYLGLRLRFEGSPANVMVTPQIMPEPATGMKKYYLVLLDAVPGGTGYLKTLFQEKDSQGRDAEGIMDVLRRAKDALETCVCRRMHQQHDKQDTDGCYRCIRTYHLQYNAAGISRERGIKLLGQLIEAGQNRVPQQALDQIAPHSLFGSMLEKKFVDTLHAFVTDKKGRWEQTIIRGGQGFRFTLDGSERLWELELQPSLHQAHGVMVQSRPDFLLRSDDDRIKPVAIFTDGFEFHCHPNNRLADDMRKRRAILESGNYHLWNVTWNDLDPQNAEHVMACQQPVAQSLERIAAATRGKSSIVPATRRIVRNGMEQLKAFLECPHAAGWTQLTSYVTWMHLQAIATQQRTVAQDDLLTSLETWRAGAALPTITFRDGADWVYNDKVALNQDLVTCISVDDAVSLRRDRVIVMTRLGDSSAEVTGSDYPERWRRFLACVNLYQFCDTFRFWTSSEVALDQAPELPLADVAAVTDDWQRIVEQIAPSLRSHVLELAAAGLPVPAGLPKVEYFNDEIDDDAFAELAWPNAKPRIALLAGDQEDFASQWQKLDWKVIVPDELQAKGVSHLVDLILKGI